MVKVDPIAPGLPWDGHSVGRLLHHGPSLARGTSTILAGGNPIRVKGSGIYPTVSAPLAAGRAWPRPARRPEPSQSVTVSQSVSQSVSQPRVMLFS